MAGTALAAARVIAWAIRSPKTLLWGTSVAPCVGDSLPRPHGSRPCQVPAIRVPYSERHWCLRISCWRFFFHVDNPRLFTCTATHIINARRRVLHFRVGLQTSRLHETLKHGLESRGLARARACADHSGAVVCNNQMFENVCGACRRHGTCSLLGFEITNVPTGSTLVIMFDGHGRDRTQRTGRMTRYLSLARAGCGK